MARRTPDHLRSLLSAYEADYYPIQKGFVSRRLLVDGRSVLDVANEVKAIVLAKEPDKELHEGSLKRHLYDLKKQVRYKRQNLTSEWPSLITLFIEPVRITFKGLPVEPASSHPEQTSVPSPSRNPEPSTSPTSEMLIEPGIAVTPTLATINSPSCLMACKLRSPRKLKNDCTNCVNKQRTIMNMLQKNKRLRQKNKCLHETNRCLHQQCREFKMLYKAEKGNFSLKKYNQKIKRKTQSVTKWKTRYAFLSEACRDTHNLLKLVESLEQQVKTLEGKLTAAQEENINMASVNEQLESMLEKTENRDTYLKQVNEQLKSKLEKAEDDNAYLKQVHEQLKNILQKPENDDAHLKPLQIANASNTHQMTMPPGYRQEINSPERAIKEEFTWEAADNIGGNFPLQNEEIKQEQIYEEHPERSQWKKTSASDNSTAISKDVISNISMKNIHCGERCQVEAEGDCLDHGSSIYIDSAELPVHTPSCITQTHVLI